MIKEGGRKNTRNWGWEDGDNMRKIFYDG